MAVFTAVSDADATALLREFELGDFVALRGIQGGIENSNFFLTTTRGEFVLTLFEQLSAAQLPFYLNFASHLAAKGLPAPAPKVDRSGRSLFTLNGKPGAIVSKLQGQPVLAPLPAHCTQLGDTLARMHVAALSYEGAQGNLRGLAWWQATVPRLLTFLTSQQRRLIQSELAFQTELASSSAYLALPRSAIHADLFRDNAMFDGTPDSARLSGVFDFYFAGVDTQLFDLAVCLNDWCIERATGVLQTPESNALLTAYTQQRAASAHPMLAAELALLPALLRAAALRFWVSRLFDLHLPRAASLLAAHDPAHFERILTQRILEQQMGHPWQPPLADLAGHGHAH